MPSSRAERSARGQEALSRNPTRPTVTVYAKRRTTNTPENQFLSFLLIDVLVKKARRIENQLQELAGYTQDHLSKQTDHQERTKKDIASLEIAKAELEGSIAIKKKDVEKNPSLKASNSPNLIQLKREKEKLTREIFAKENEHKRTKARIEILTGSLEKLITAQKALTDNSVWSSRALTVPWLKGVVPLRASPTRPSPYLVRSEHYAQVYRTFIQVQRLPQIAQLTKQEGSITSTLAGLAPTTLLFEQWAFLECYDSLLEMGFTALGASPMTDQLGPVGRNSPFKGKSYRLTMMIQTHGKSVVNTESKSNPEEQPRRKIEITLKYENEDKDTGRCPDITAVITVTNEMNGEVTEYPPVFLDAKYRNYKSMKLGHPIKKYDSFIRTYGSMIGGDFLATAKEHYLDSLNGLASFILHSDPEVKDFWGEVSYHEAFNPGAQYTSETESALHRYGGLCIRPTQNTQQTFRTFWWMIFTYHLKLVDICFPCRQHVPGKKAKRGKGHFYSCPDCMDWWVVNVCGPKEHILIKHVERSFHRQLLGQHGLYYLCPDCGAGKR
ncbi:hypothetical protein ACFSC4_15755 [Deinococcus malanensis]|uniref:hypothetical protein n=1 Tax=Deinococcus malanensis TaxID=1706855 RepID=UPI003642ED61